MPFCNCRMAFHNLGTMTFRFFGGRRRYVENTAPITINNLGPASPYPATINVSGLAGVIGNVRVTLIKLAHSFPDDIDALLVGRAARNWC